LTQYQDFIGGGRKQTVPAVAMDASGEFVVVWEAAGGHSMFAQRFGDVPPRVTGVFVSGSAWTAAFKDHLQAQDLGDATFGYRVPGGPQQLDVLPWSNVDQLTVRFSDDVVIEDAALQYAPVRAASGFQYRAASHAATWTFEEPLHGSVLFGLNGDRHDGDDAGVGFPFPPGPFTPEHVVMNGARVFLDGEWLSGSSDFPSGDGLPGGDFLLRLNILPGDADRNGAVLANDFSAVKQRFFATPSSAGYSVFHDIDGSGSILAGDFSTVKAHFFDRLPEQGSINGSGTPFWLYGGGHEPVGSNIGAFHYRY
jgi:hypothetical protein